jgi:hypothetical protein
MKKIELFYTFNDGKFNYVIIDENGPRTQEIPNGRMLGMIDERLNGRFDMVGSWQDKEHNPTEFIVGFVKR